MTGLDRRMLHRERAARAFVLAGAGLGLVGTGAIIAQAVLLANAINAVVADGAGRADLRAELAGLAGAIAVRAGVAWAGELAAHRAAAAVKADLRGRLFAHVAALGPGWIRGERSGEITTLATHGLDALDGYFARYLPQLILAALVPAVVVIAVAPADLIAAATILLTVPLVPVFMYLVGQATERYNQRQFAVLARLTHHFLEIIAGLPTLKAFGRAKAQAATIRTLTDAQRRITMRTLRLAFLSSLVLELLATVSVALVAVGVGLRVVGGSLDLRTALLVLILAPEAYLPLRQLGASYHASAEGLAAAGRVFAILAEPVPPRGTATDLPEAITVVLRGATVCYPGRRVPAISGISLRLAPGRIVALTGPSGSGKSTVLLALAGLCPLSSGTVTIGPDLTLSDVDPDAWRSRIAWLPQRPYLFAGSVVDNIRLGRPDAPIAEVRRAAVLAQAGDLLSTVVGEDGAGLSDGQRQRVALARALVCDRPVLLLDEPTAHLDDVTEAAVIATIRAYAAGRTVLLVAHRPALLALADEVIVITSEDSPAPHQASATPSDAVGATTSDAVGATTGIDGVGDAVTEGVAG